MKALSKSAATSVAVKEHLFRRAEGRLVRSRASRVEGAGRILIVLEAVDLAPPPEQPSSEAPDPEQLVQAAGLTPRERTVAQLVARGLSNGEAAARLRVRSSTIAEHLTNVFRKLAVANRIELIRLLTRGG